MPESYKNIKIKIYRNLIVAIRGFEWLWSLVSFLKGRAQTGVWEQCIKDYI
jgi:hypothetical protein